MIRVLFICHGISIHALFAEGDGKYAQFNSAYLINLYIS